MKDKKVNVNVFCKYLKKMLSDRIDKFEVFIKNADISSSRTTQDWFISYKEYTTNSNNNINIDNATYLVMRAASRVVEENKIVPHTAIYELKQALDNLTEIHKKCL